MGKMFHDSASLLGARKEIGARTPVSEVLILPHETIPANPSNGGPGGLF
jgi:hypothetical protein